MRIPVGMTYSDSIKVLSDGNGEVIFLLIDFSLYLVEQGMGPMGQYVDVIYALDNTGLYGKDILTLFNNVCENDKRLLTAFIQACQYGCKPDINIVVLGSFLKEQGFDSAKTTEIKDRISKFLPKLSVTGLDHT